jgi:subtilisin-like proprotein convertase family protein
MKRITIVLLLMLLLSSSSSTFAVAPPSHPNIPATTTSFNSTATPIPIPDVSTITDQITVSGMGDYLLDVDLTTFIPHTFPGDIDMTLTSPAGTVVVITTDNAASNDNVFNGTLWDDSATTPVTDYVFTINVLASPLIPEGSLGAFVGENPNGIWTLTITDDRAADIGALVSWSLDITTFPFVPLTDVTLFNSTATPIPIPDVSIITDQITVSGIEDYLLDVDLTTFIPHTFSGDIDMTLTSPAGTVVVITTDNAGTNDNVFNGTLWDDSASTPVTDRIYASNVIASPLSPEGALSAFVGENPNGVWTLTITDDTLVDIGTLNSWSLNIMTLSPPRYLSTPAEGNIPLTTPENVAITQSIVITEGGQFDLDIATVTLTGDAAIMLDNVNPAVPYTIVDNSGDSVELLIVCRSAVAGNYSSVLSVTHNGLGAIATYNITCNVTETLTSTSTSTSTSTENTNFINIHKLGLSSTVNGTQVIEWVVTVSNQSGVNGQNVTITDTVIPALRIQNVIANGATVSIDGQTVRVVYPTLNIGETVQFSLFTSVQADTDFTNSACVSANNQPEPICTTASAVGQLPATGETPIWRDWLIELLGE